jgi:hypothetical protein
VSYKPMLLELLRGVLCHFLQGILWQYTGNIHIITCNPIPAIICIYLKITSVAREKSVSSLILLNTTCRFTPGTPDSSYGLLDQ